MFRFTIRELVLLTLVVTMGVGWWMERTKSSRLSRREHYLMHAIMRSGFEPSGDALGPILIERQWQTVSPGEN